MDPFEYMEDEKAQLYLDARVHDDGIYVSITQWAECMGVTMPKDRALAFGEWLISASRGAA